MDVQIFCSFLWCSALWACSAVPFKTTYCEMGSSYDLISKMQLLLLFLIWRFLKILSQTYSTKCGLITFILRSNDFSVREPWRKHWRVQGLENSFFEQQKNVKSTWKWNWNLPEICPNSSVWVKYPLNLCGSAPDKTKTSLYCLCAYDQYQGHDTNFAYIIRTQLYSFPKHSIMNIFKASQTCAIRSLKVTRTSLCGIFYRSCHWGKNY